MRLEDSSNGAFMMHLNFDSSLVVEVKSKQHLHPLLMELKKSVFSKLNESFFQGGNGVLGNMGDYGFPILRI